MISPQIWKTWGGIMPTRDFDVPVPPSSKNLVHHYNLAAKALMPDHVRAAITLQNEQTV